MTITTCITNTIIITLITNVSIITHLLVDALFSQSGIATQCQIRSSKAQHHSQLLPLLMI